MLQEQDEKAIQAYKDYLEEIKENEKKEMSPGGDYS